MTPAVAITGAGVVSPFGATPLALWDALAAQPDARTPWPYARAARYPHERVVALADAPRAPRAARPVQAMVRRALAQALGPEGLPPAPWRSGCILGTTTAGVDALEHELLNDGAPGDADDGVADLLPPDMPWTAGASVLSAACASGLLAPALAAERLALGEADFMLAGGADALLDYTLGGFNSLRLTGDAPCRPFDAQRQSVVLSEGAVMLRLEPLAQARARRAPVLGVILGYAFNCDGSHMTAPDPAGIARAIEGALHDARTAPSAIGCVFAHGTGTPANDAAEAAALAEVFGAGGIPPVAAVKSVLGHSQAAAGAFSLLAALLALRRGVLPPVAHSQAVDPALAGIRLARSGTASGALALVNAFGFGGNNCVMVIARGEDAP